jgi:hypothetical protein
MHAGNVRLTTHRLPRAKALRALLIDIVNEGFCSYLSTLVISIFSWTNCSRHYGCNTSGMSTFFVTPHSLQDGADGEKSRTRRSASQSGHVQVQGFSE